MERSVPQNLLVFKDWPGSAVFSLFQLLICSHLLRPYKWSHVLILLERSVKVMCE